MNNHETQPGATAFDGADAWNANTHATAMQLQRCAIAVSDWLAGGCDVHDIPRPHIAALVAWTKETTSEAAALGPNAELTGTQRPTKEQAT